MRTSISTDFLPSCFAAAMSALTSWAASHRLAGDLQDDIAVRQALAGGQPSGST